MKIQELAKEVGVSTATVSRVFSHHPNVSDDIKKRVREVARKYGYHPRLSSKQQNVVIITPYNRVYPIQSYVEMVISELSQELSARHYRIEIIPQDNIEQLHRVRFCAAIGIGTEPEVFSDWSEKFAEPLIIIDKEITNLSENIYSICSNEEQAMDLAIEHFAQKGFEKVGSIIYGLPDQGNACIRKNAIIKALKRHNLPVSEQLIRISLEEGYIEEIGRLLNNGVDALFCPGGNAGVISAYALCLYNKKIPQDISLITSERSFFSRYATPPQTTISQDYKAQAIMVADALDARINGQEFPKRTLMPYKLIVRDSVK